MSRGRSAAVALILVGLVLRVSRLTLNPLHHDEGINAFFMLKLFREGKYHYDPANYHGPLLYYLDLPLLKLFGLETWNLRLLTVVFGVGLLLLLLFGRLFSRRASLFSTALVTVSPGMVYYSRYFIHEMLVVFFTLGVVFSLFRYRDTSIRWWLFAASASAGFLFATKETAMPTVVVLVLAALCTRLLLHLSPSIPADTQAPAEPLNLRWGTCLGLAFVFLAITVSLYSSWYGNFDGVKDVLQTFAFWTKTGTNEHVHPLWQYVLWLIKEEAPIFVLGGGGIAVALFRRTSRAAVFCAFWSLGVFAMYSLIPYKTPWLSLNIILPFALMAGYLLEEGVQTLGDRVGAALVAVALAVGLTQSVSLNFSHYDDNTRPYVYAHTVRDLDRLVGMVEALVRKRGPETKIAVVAEHYWPLPWLWREYPGALFYGKMVPLDNVPLVVALSTQEAEVRRASDGKLRKVGGYVLRPGVDLVLWADSSVTAGMTAASGEGAHALKDGGP